MKATGLMFFLLTCLPLKGLEPFAITSQIVVSNESVLFYTSFITQTNYIYGLERSFDLETWDLLPPEIDGTGEMDYFIDPVLNELDYHEFYRVTVREGVLPPDEE